MIISVYHGIPIMTWAGEVWPEVPLEGGVQNFALPRFHSIHKTQQQMPRVFMFSADWSWSFVDFAYKFVVSVKFG